MRSCMRIIFACFIASLSFQGYGASEDKYTDLEAQIFKSSPGDLQPEIALDTPDFVTDSQDSQYHVVDRQDLVKKGAKVWIREGFGQYTITKILEDGNYVLISSVLNPMSPPIKKPSEHLYFEDKTLTVSIKVPGFEEHTADSFYATFRHRTVFSYASSRFLVKGINLNGDLLIFELKYAADFMSCLQTHSLNQSCFIPAPEGALHHILQSSLLNETRVYPDIQVLE